MNKGMFTFILTMFLLLSGTAVAAENKEDNWENESIYYIMIDRFNNGDTTNDFTVDSSDPTAYHGGDFKGVELQLDYIKKMGFTTIALSPIFANQEKGYQGYWVNDFKKTEEHFGTLKQFKSLVKEAHKRDLKVIIEFAPNMVGADFPFLKEANKKDWFNSNQSGQPLLNLGNSDVQDYLVEVGDWWIAETDIDGYVLDQSQPNTTEFWNNFSKEIKQSNPSVFLLSDNTALDGEETEKDGIADYQGNQVLRKGFAKPDAPLADMIPILEKNQQISSQTVVANFMDNLRMNRFTHEAVVNNLHPGSRWKLALSCLYTAPGVPVVYYGSEIALEGNASDHKQMDFRTDQDLVDYITKLGELRNKIPALTKGTFEPLYAEGGMIVYKREYEGEIAVIAINNTSKTQNITIEADKIAEDMQLQGLLMDDQAKAKDGKYKLIVDRDEAEIYMVTEKSGLNIPYIVVMGIVYLLFTVFIIMLLKRRKRKATE